MPRSLLRGDSLQENFAQLKSTQTSLLDVDFMFVDRDTLTKILNESQEIEIAKQKAGLTEEDEYEIVEIPKYKGLINLGLPSLPYAIEAEMDPVITFIKLLNKHRGKPLVIMEPGSYPVVE